MIKQKYLIKAPVEDVWEALTNPDIIDKWGGGPSKFDKRIGGNFSFWGGDIWGKNMEIIDKKKLVQEWFGGDWPKPSIATFKIMGDGKITMVELLHKNVPRSEEADFADGWKRYFLGEIKKLLEI
jgi:activator of HSP90 ATPase